MRRGLFLTLLLLALCLFSLSVSNASEYSTLFGNDPGYISNASNEKRYMSESGLLGVNPEFPKFFLSLIVPNKRGGQFIELENSDYQGAGVSEIVQMFPYEGGYSVGLSETLSLGPNWEVGVEGFYLIPQINEAQSFYYFDNGLTGYFRSWDHVDTQIGLVGLELRGMWDDVWRKQGWSVVFGLRFDSCSVKFKDPSSVSKGADMPSAPGYSADDTVDINSRAYIPYIGLQFDQKNHFLSGSFKGIVFPAVLGQVSYKESFLGAPMQHYSTTTNFKKSFVFELNVDAAYHLTEMLGLGCFAKMGIINSYPTGTLEISQGGNVTSNISYEMDYRKIQYIVGAQFRAWSW